jgi:hypothetical protein
MQPHQERVIVERDELKSRLDKLNAFLGGDVFKSLPEIEQFDMNRQSSAMLNYLQILDSRISRFETSPAKENG